MKKNRITLTVTLLFMAMLIVPATLAALDKAPRFSLPGKTAKPVRLRDYIGKIVYVDFWASWCGPCRESFPWMNQMNAKYGENGFVIIAINLDSEKAMADRFLRKQAHDFRIAFDPEGKIAQKYRLRGMPSSFIIDREGNIRYTYMGFLRHKKPQMERQIKDLLNANSVGEDSDG